MAVIPLDFPLSLSPETGTDDSDSDSGMSGIQCGQAEVVVHTQTTVCEPGEDCGGVENVVSCVRGASVLSVDPSAPTQPHQ